MPYSMKPIVGIIGSRSITTLNLDLFIDKTHVGEIVSGGANGVDKIAENWAKKNKIEFIAMLPNYKLLGSHWAPLKRDEDIVDYCDLIICFWDTKSSGSKYTINYALKTSKQIILHEIIDR